MINQLTTFIGCLIFAFCISFRGWLESDPITHILVQLPLLALCGPLIMSTQITSRIADLNFNRGGIASLLIAIFTITYWMLPRAIDASLTSIQMEIFKFISLPLLLGIPLVVGWRRAHPLLRGFIKAEAISMLGFLAFLYTHAPIRICNSYLVDDQQRLGFAFLMTAILLGIFWSAPLFFQTQNSNNQDQRLVSQ